MDIAVRYCSKTKFGNTRRIAEAIADGIGVKAVSIADEPSLKDKADILFLGGAPYANIMAPELREYADNLDPAMASKVVLFTTSNWSKRTVLALKKILKAKGNPIKKALSSSVILQIIRHLMVWSSYQILLQGQAISWNLSGMSARWRMYLFQHML